jgi:hypothetical protein
MSYDQMIKLVPDKYQNERFALIDHIGDLDQSFKRNNPPPIYSNEEDVF